MNVLHHGRGSLERRRRGRLRIAVGCAAAASLILAGCQLPGTSAGGHPPVGSAITVASVPGIGGAPLYIALQDRLFRQRGLRVTVHSYSSVAAEVDALQAGQADIAVGDYANFFYAQESDASAPLRVVADAYDAGPNVMDVLALPHSGITGPQSLVKKTVGTAAPSSSPTSATTSPTAWIPWRRRQC